GRADGWPGLKAAYKMPYAMPSGLDHGLAYEAIAAGKIDDMDIYSTDAKIERYALRVLEDDRKYFPSYEAVLLYRLEVPKRFPEAWRALQTLEGRIDERKMIRMNAAAELEGKSFAEAAALIDSDGKPALALGPDPRERLSLIDVPLPLPAILAGITPSAVINVGPATIAAFIGAGGYGARIASGLALNDNVTLLAGAIPAAALALLI